MSETERVVPATVGQTFMKDGEELTVGEKCALDSGAWYCITHGKGFTNNLGKDNHIHRGKHVMVWLCFVHGPEVP